ncbi:hypothetical protein GS914_17480 [Rhodococcus hoagii]|nr:hypothetical protein [Prescottella equi]NKT16749.1 hypothetical protein [Prescottella equi]NKU08442.1 hypothetical protein [Prescottella equi]NKU37704.1 hypothetical protein [Prescottella equi]NKU84747.1 hypothetical protein [Prescottella equi]
MTAFLGGVNGSRSVARFAASAEDVVAGAAFEARNLAITNHPPNQWNWKIVGSVGH